MRNKWFSKNSIMKNKFLYIYFQKSIYSAFKGIVSRDSIFINLYEVTSVHSCVRLCFALKGQCHKIFSSGFFHESSSPKPLKIHKFVTFADLPHVWQFAVLWFADPIFFAICWPKLVADLQLLQICKFFIYLLTNTYLKCSNSNFYKKKFCRTNLQPTFW